MNDLDNIKKFKNDIDNIEVPTEIDFAIEKGLKKKEKRDKIKRLSIYFATAAALIIIIFNIPFVKTRVGDFCFQNTDLSGIAAIDSFENLKSTLGNCKKSNKETQSADHIAPASDNVVCKGTNEAESGNSARHSSTNVQVNGVDEPDVIKNDGKFIYTLSTRNNKIMIVNAYPAHDMKLEATIALDGNFHPGNMFFKDNFLVVLGPYSEDSTDINMKSHWHPSEESKILVYNISNRKKPQLAKSLIVSGRYRDSRLIGDKVYTISNESIDLDSEDARNASKEDFKPFYIDSSLKGKTKKIDYKNIVYNTKDVYPNYIIISSIDLSNITSEAKVTSVLGNGKNIYCNGKSMYIASQNSKDKTIIYKLSLSNGKAKLQNKTEVSGSLLNQFSMDEYNGYLRTAVSENVNHDSENQVSSTVYIFDEKLKLVSKLSGIAKGEKIYSARFLGNRAYLVTFDQSDPLFTLDLSNPKKPKITGKLEMPGFSSYLQPYDENHIIGFGRNIPDVVKNGYSQTMPYGVKFAMFDVTDTSNPKQMYNVNFEDVKVNTNSSTNLSKDASDNATDFDSDVLRDHKALLLDKNKRIMAIPIVISGDNVHECDIYVYKINLKTGFKLVYKGKSDGEQGVTSRAAYIGDTLYTVFDSKIVAVDLNSFKDIGELKF